MTPDQSDRIRTEAQFTVGYLVWLADELHTQDANICAAAADALRWVAEGVRVSPDCQPDGEGR